jgi:hypothetical protein
MNKVFKIITNITLEQNDELVDSYTPEQLATVEELSDFISTSDDYAFVNENGHIFEYIITTPEVMDRIHLFGEQVGHPIESIDVTELVGVATDEALLEFLHEHHGKDIN